MTLLAPLLLGCALRAPPLPAAAPPPAEDYRTGPPAELRGLVKHAARRLAEDAAAEGRVAEVDQRLSDAAARVLIDFRRNGDLPDLASLQRRVAEAGAPYVVPLVAVVPLRPGRKPDTSAWQTWGRSLPGSAELPVVAGIAAFRDGDEVWLVHLMTRRAFTLAAPLPRSGGVAELVPVAPFGELGARWLGQRGVERTSATTQDGRAALTLPAAGWVDLVAVDGGTTTALGVVALGEVPPPAEPDGDARSSVISGLQALRDRWGLPELELVGGTPYCGQVPDVLEGLEVTRHQSCREVPAWGTAGAVWDAVVQRPFALESIGDPRAELLQVEFDGDASQVAVRTAERFERLTPDELRDRLLDGLRARWPGVRHDPEPLAFVRLAEQWAAAGALTDEGMAPLVGAADDAAGRWSPEPAFFRVMAAAQTVDELLSFVPADAPAPTVAALGTALGQGPDGEPLYFVVIALATP